MRALRFLVAFALSGVLCISTSVSPAAAVEIECGKNDKGKIMWCEVTELGTPGDPGGNVNVDLEYVPYRWIRMELQTIECTELIVPPPPSPALPYREGTRWAIWLEDTRTGLEVGGPRVECVYPPADPPAPPPAPPTPGAVLQSLAPLLVLEPSHDPYVRGLTGLDTKLWCTGGSQVSTEPITLGGWTVQATAIRTGVSWNISGPESVTLPGVGGCGNAEAPSVVWMPNVTGAYEITVNGTWTITYTASYSGGGFNVSITVPVGSLTISTTPLPFDVIESPGVLVG